MRNRNIKFPSNFNDNFIIKQHFYLKVFVKCFAQTKQASPTKCGKSQVSQQLSCKLEVFYFKDYNVYCNSSLVVKFPIDF